MQKRSLTWQSPFFVAAWSAFGVFLVGQKMYVQNILVIGFRYWFNAPLWFFVPFGGSVKTKFNSLLNIPLKCKVYNHATRETKV